MKTLTILLAFLALVEMSHAQIDSLFQNTAPSLAIIETAHGTGSGFVANMKDKKYLITNEHVFRGGEPVTAKLVSGKKLKFKKVEVANDRDLVRLLLKNQSIQSLQISTNAPTINEKVYVYGNSAGSGVATQISGKIRGIGPDRVEVDAKFIRGNSGSPMLLGDGTAFAVATYITRPTDPSDWVKKGTRYTKTRRFGFKLTNVKWVELTRENYFIRANALADLKTYCFDVFDLMHTDKYTNKDYRNRFSYSYKKIDQDTDRTID